ncbi:lecithin retinol acyltransferase family protein [Clostridium formicaceticum]|uniref:NC domain protein n=1 Tax=Clostridium formicaceticum TaxID=1497 RepID=A0AAC9RLV4_9CLOT|nr:lecithin retinol acyltransferase family protein [Clostridium formicaceticum]AOY77396.1 hypothetical protein BJL90_16980 [Clostridium formicaceticum]ARE87947.1 NC domain protein [Clostridium formicaceticum]
MAKGDHIVVERPHGWVAAGMLHHGIDLGDNTVVHFTGATSQTAKVIRTNIRTFAKNGSIKVVDYEEIRNSFSYMYKRYKFRKLLDEYCSMENRDPDEVVRFSLENLGRTGGGYHPASNNCEHFATLMRKGMPFSLQVENAVDNIDSSLHPIGNFVSQIVMELLRFKTNPYQHQPKDGVNYLGSIYEHNGLYYHECYEKPFFIPPRWFVSVSSEQWEEIDQKSVPYPLREINTLFE